MIDISKNLINTFITERNCKLFSKRALYGLGDKQLTSVYADYLKHKDKKENILFTKNTVERVSKMDISKVKPNTLSFLGEKYNKEFAFCFLEKENISFCYSIDVNTIKLIVFNGNRNTIVATTKENWIKNKVDYSSFEKAIVGSAIINFPLDDLEVMPSNAFYYLDKPLKDVPEDYRNDILKASKDKDYLQQLRKDCIVKAETIFLAVKAFIFLKTASVIDKTFISGDKKFGVKNKFGITSKRNEITIINSFYDESITVLNPFAVSGHFRNQPYKDKVEVIYIDSFMKKGYKRPAKILSLKENDKN